MSMLRAAVFAAALGAALGGAALGVHALTADFSLDPPALVAGGDVSRDPASTTSSARIDSTGNNIDRITPSARSPSEGMPFQSAAVYHSASAGAEAPFALGGPLSSSGLLFGSLDPYDAPSFFRNGAEVFDLTGTDFVPPGKLGLGAVYVQMSDLPFDEVSMSSSGDLSGFTDLFSLAAVPVPASLPLLLGGLIGLRLLARRRRADQG